MRWSLLSRACFAFSLACVASCGGATDATTDSNGGGGGAPDGAVAEGAPDAAPDEAATIDVVEADAPVGDFCSGSSKASLGSALVDPAPVTTTMLVMNCCEGFFARFHTESALGADVSMMVRAFGAQMKSGDYDLPLDGGSLEVQIADAKQPFGGGLPAKGKVHLEVPASYDQPVHASFCLEAHSPGDPLDGVRLFASDLVVAPYAWQSRLEVRLLADPTTTAQAAASQPLDTLALATGSATFDLLSMEFYEASTNTGFWDPPTAGQAIANTLPTVGVYGLPFVVLADSQRVYLGAFMTSVSSVSVDMPVIVVDEMKGESFRVDWGYPASTPPAQDPRGDARIVKVLGEAGKLVQ